MNLREWNRTSLMLDFNRHKISYHDSGNANSSSILFLHGFPTSSWDWRYLWEGLKHEYRLITLDLLGYGYSDKPRYHRYSIHEHADIVEYLLENIGVEKINIAAHDIGDNITQELLARNNEGSTQFSICSTLFLNGALFPSLQKHTFLQTVMPSSLGFILSALTTRKSFENQLKSIIGVKSALNEQDLDDIWELVNHRKGHKLSHKLMSYIDDRKVFEARWVNALENATDIPSTYINGNADPVCGTVMLEQFKKLSSKSIGKGIDGVGHYPHLERPEIVLQLYKHFLQTVDE